MASLANSVRSGGYDCEFVEPPPSAFQVDCAICLLKLRDPQLVSCCGKNFCNLCIRSLQLHGQQCPTCNSPFTTFPNKGLKQSLTQLHVYCTHRSDGCEWTGELGELEQHVNTKCLHALVNCTFKYAGCEVQLPSKDMPAHVAESVGAHLELLGTHNHKLAAEIASKDENIERLKVKIAWLEMFVAVMIALAAMMFFQIDAIGSTVVSLQGKYGTIEENITSLQQQYRTIKTQFLHESPHDTPVCDSHPSEYVGDQEKLAQPPAQDNKKMEEMDQLISRQHQLRWIVAHLIAMLTTLAASCIILPLFQIFGGAGTPVPCTISLYNFEKYRSNRTAWYSRPFLTHIPGYKMRLRVDANGIGSGEGTHISVTTHVMQGQFDGMLNWPFRGNITVQLLDQEGTEEHHTRVISYSDRTPDTSAGRVTAVPSKGWGDTQFIPHNELAPKYLRDNCLHFEILKVELTGAVNNHPDSS